MLGGLAYHEHVRDQAQAFNTGYFTKNDASWVVDLPGPNNLMNNNVVPEHDDAAADHQRRRSRSIPMSASIAPASRARPDYGVFGQSHLDAAALRATASTSTGGLRWTDDQKKGTLLLTNNYRLLNQDGSLPAAQLHEHTWKRVDPMVNLAVDLSQRHAGLWQVEHRL